MTLIDWRLFVFSATLSYSIRKASGNRVFSILGHILSIPMLL